MSRRLFFFSSTKFYLNREGRDARMTYYLLEIKDLKPIGVYTINPDGKMRETIIVLITK